MRKFCYASSTQLKAHAFIRWLPHAQVEKDGEWQYIQEGSVARRRALSLHTVRLLSLLRKLSAQEIDKILCCRNGYQKASRNFNSSDLDVDVTRWGL